MKIFEWLFTLPIISLKKPIKQVTILRTFSGDKETLGELVTENFSCKTLELGWRGNQNNISCIPVGKYICKFTRSNRLSQIAGKDIFTYEVLNVPNRAGIRIHAANFVRQLLGCVALGTDFVDIDNDGSADVTSSKLAIAEFERVMEKQDFELQILNKGSI